MTNGMAINSAHSSNFPLLVRSVTRPVLPMVRQQYETIPGRDGSYDYSDGKLEDAVVSVECSLITESITSLRAAVRAISQWIYGNGGKVRLRFDDEPAVFYYGRIANQIDPEQIATIGEFTLQFRCDPFAYSSETIIEQTFTASPYSVTVSSQGSVGSPPVIILTNQGGSTVQSFTIKSENLAN